MAHGSGSNGDHGHTASLNRACSSSWEAGAEGSVTDAIPDRFALSRVGSHFDRMRTKLAENPTLTIGCAQSHVNHVIKTD